MIDVLLVSPRLPSGDPRRSGDNTYTDMLLAHPPAGVRFHHYEDLIAQGRMRRIRSLELLGHNLTRTGLLPPDMWAEYLTSDEQPDLVHIYGFSASVRLSSCPHPVPVILGAGTGSFSDLKYYRGWKKQRIRRARQFKRWYLAAVQAHDSSLRPERAAHVLTWSDFSRQMHLEEGYVKPERISTLYPGLPLPQTTVLRESDQGIVTFLFVGRDFDRKNGNLVLEAFRRVHSHHPNTQLLLVGLPQDGRTINEDGVLHRHFVPHENLLHEVFPQVNVLLLPSRAEGFGLVIVEAMSFGIPAIAVDAWAMPEILQNGVNGFLVRPNSTDDLVDCMLRLVTQPELLAHMKLGAAQVFQERFSIESHNQQLKRVYDEALSSERNR